jgi:hypothetical protein
MLKKYSTLLTRGKANHKLDKSRNSDYLVYGLSLAPHKLSGYNTCASASPECIRLCINTAGFGGIFPNVIESRIARTKLLFENRGDFETRLFRELDNAVKFGLKHNKKVAVRLNVFSDIQWENILPEIFDQYPTIQFYDYTKHVARMTRFLSGQLPNNYHLTFSRSEKNERFCFPILEKYGNVTVVFNHKNSLPKTWRGFPVISGDNSDLRFLDPVGRIVGLKAKGRARNSTGGFVV